MNRKFFGTDGIRGKANTPPMDAETVLRVGMAAGAYFRNGSHRHRVVIGKDTRLSGYMLEPALTSGFISMGMDVILVGPMPTPAISMLTRSLRADLGVMISASHNPFGDNGIKFFDAKGLKLSDRVERELEKLMAGDMAKLRASADNLGRARRLDDAPGRYIEFIKNTFPRNFRLDGLKIVVDCAHGAAYKLAPTILWELGAEVVELGVDPNGININRHCGSTHPELMCSRVAAEKADIGIALDGDADRLMLCDERGQLADGDRIMAAIAGFWQESGRLTGQGIVGTSMSNLGMEHYLGKLGLTLERADVGDRYVIEKMRAGGKHGRYNFGGEQSGHIIFGDYATTGDGTLAALQILALMVEKKQSASKVLNVFTPYPQILRNVRIEGNGGKLLAKKTVKDAVKAAQKKLGTHGRVLIRKSGTEPLIRVMCEGEDAKLIARLADGIVEVIQHAG